MNIDECESSPCLNDGVCSDGINGFQCNCSQGYVGDRCEQDVDECQSNPCLNNGTCENLPGSYECKCEKYYLGKQTFYAPFANRHLVIPAINMLDRTKRMTIDPPLIYLNATQAQIFLSAI